LGAWRIEDGADAAGAGVRVGGLGCCQQVVQRGLGLGQFGHAPLGFGQVLVQQGGDVGAWRAAVVSDGEDAADLGEGEAGGLGGADEGEAGGGVVRVVAVAGRGARRPGSRPACS
jgi:hypothetical protein